MQHAHTRTHTDSQGQNREEGHRAAMVVSKQLSGEGAPETGAMSLPMYSR